MLAGLHSDEEVGRFHINDMKPFLARQEHESPTHDWRSIAEINQQIRARVKESAKEETKRIKDAKRMTQMKKKRRRAEAREHIYIPSQEGRYEPTEPTAENWWSDYIDFPEDYGDEEDWNFWSTQTVALDDLSQY